MRDFPRIQKYVGVPVNQAALSAFWRLERGGGS